MLKRIGVENRLELIIFVSLILLVTVTPLGREATHPIVLGLYRTLLIVLTVTATLRMRQFALPQICYRFLGATALVVLAMYGSVVLRPGSHFEGIYTFYQNVLFLAAFIALASFNRTRTVPWKNALLAVVVSIDIIYLASAWIQGMRPLLGPFVNANYFASYLLVGLAICVSAALNAETREIRLAAGAAGLLLFYGILQTSSRGVFLSVLVVVAAGLFRVARRSRIPWLRLTVIGVLIIGMAAAANPSLLQKFTDRGQRDPYNYERTKIWMEAVSMVAAHPVLGVGLARYYYVSKLFTPAMEGTIGRYPKWANIAHSEYLQYMAELGVPVALMMFALGGYLFRLAWQRSKGMPPENRIHQEAAILAAIGLGVHALVDNNWTVPVVAAGLAVISLADLLPYRQWPFHVRWTPVQKTALAVCVTAVFVQSVTLPMLGLYFNESGHRAFVAGNFKQAESMHRLALGILPSHPLLLDNLGMVYFDEYAKTKKIEYLDRAESLFRDSMNENPSFDLPAGHLETALFQRLTGNVAADQAIHAQIVAVDQLRLRVTPFNPFTRGNLAEALYNMGQKNQASEELKKAVEMEPNYVEAYMRLAQWAEKSGQSQEAEEYRTKANAIVIHYKDQATLEPFEAMLLNRPLPSSGKP